MSLYCNSINSVFSSAAGFTGAWAVGQIGGQIAGQIGSQAFLQGAGLFASAKTAAATGAAIGSSIGPIGTVIGSVVGGIIIGIGANAIVSTANKDAGEAFGKCIADINSHIELSGYDKLYYFADSMESLSEFRLSFKNLLPCYNLISDLREYNLHKKAIKAIDEQLKTGLKTIECEKEKALIKIEEQHNQRVKELLDVFAEQRRLLRDESVFRDSINTYIANSYMQYVDTFYILQGNTNALLEELTNCKTEHSYVIDYMCNRNEVNKSLNEILHEALENDEDKQLKPIIDSIIRFIQQDELIVGRQYISFDEALSLVDGGSKEW